MLAACSGTSAHFEQINGNHVMRHIERVVGYGPHPPGSEAHRKVGEYITAKLEYCDLETHAHSFAPVTPRGRIEMTNIWGVSRGKSDRVIILASHYDSKYFEEFPFVGANDPGSSIGLLLEIARILARRNPTDFSLWFVFFDGEEALLEWTSADSLYGSRQFVRMLKGRGELHKISAFILLDMVGEKDLLLRRDVYSTDWLKDIIWKKAAEMGHGNIFTEVGSTGVQDDHLPFAEEGIPVVDIIDLDYAYHHLQGDTLDKLSARNLELVGNVVVAGLPEMARRLTQSK